MGSSFELSYARFLFLVSVDHHSCLHISFSMMLAARTAAASVQKGRC